MNLTNVMTQYVYFHSILQHVTSGRGIIYCVFQDSIQYLQEVAWEQKYQEKNCILYHKYGTR